MASHLLDMTDVMEAGNWERHRLRRICSTYLPSNTRDRNINHCLLAKMSFDEIFDESHSWNHRIPQVFEKLTLI